MKKVLFVGNRLPNNQTAGGILYDNILKKYGIKNFSLMAVSEKINLSDFHQDYKSVHAKQFALRIPHINIFFKIISKLPLIEPIYIFLVKKLILKKILKYANAQNCDLIFASLRGDVLLILKELLKETKLPLVAMVEDTVEREVDDHKLVYYQLRKNYYKLLPKISKLAVAGETMQDYFNEKFGIESVILRPSYSKFSNKPLKQITNLLRIFFSGNIYAPKEMKAFLEALQYFASNNSHLKIEMYIASHRPVIWKSSSLKVVNLGWINENRLIEYMEECHISYLPYKSERAFMHSMKYAFPAKAGFYITNNLPIFFHGPSYSSFNTFIKKYQVGISCASMEKSVIADFIERFINDQNSYTCYQKECFKAFEMEYTMEIFEDRVKDFFLIE